MSELTQDLLKGLFEYRQGALYWRHKANTNGLVEAGSRAGYTRPDGRVQIRIHGNLYYSYRLIYLYCHGIMPEQIDHIDRDPTNNKISNLRNATFSQNMMNSGLRWNNTTGFKGVFKSRDKYRAQFNSKYIGSFISPRDAARAYNVEAIKRYGKYAWINDV